MSILDDLSNAVEAAAQNHFAFCNLSEHNYDLPDSQMCRATFPVEFPTIGFGDEVQSISVELLASHIEAAQGRPTPTAQISWNGGIPDHEFETWKLKSIAYTLLAAEAHARGDKQASRAFMDAAQAVIVARWIEYDGEQETATPEPAKPGPWDRPKYVQGGHPEDGFITYDQYEVEQSLAAGIPQWVIHRAADGVRFVVVGALDEQPVNEGTFTEFGDAKAMRDRLNEQARADAKLQSAQVIVRDRNTFAHDEDDDSPAVTVVRPQENPVFIVQHGDCGHYQVGSNRPAYNGRSVDGEHYTDFDKAARAATVLNAAQQVFDESPIPFRHTQTAPHPRAVHDAAVALGVDPTAEEIAAAVRVVMA